MIGKDFSPTAQNDKGEITQNDKAHTCHTQALPPCHTERSEVSHNTESKRDFSHSLKMTKGKQLKMTTAYKPSGIEWLGEIPQSWEIVKIKQVSKVVTGKTPCLENEWGNEMPFITPTDCFLDTKYTSLSQRKLSKIGIKNYNSIIIPQDSILVTCIASIGKVVMSNKEVITNQQINSVIPNTDLISPDFAFYVLLVTMPFAENYFCGYSILPILNKSEFSNIKIPLPPLQEQKEIAEFLDSKCEKIQNYIDKKQKLITLLQEKKQALINEAVCGRVACHTADSHCHTQALPPCHTERSEVSHNTESKRDFSPTAQNNKKGITQNDKAHTCHTQALPPCHTERSEVSTMESRFFANAQNDKGNISYKDSGIEYLGLIPHHWEVIRSGLIYKNISSGTTPQSDNDEYYKNGNIFWINSGDLNDSVLTNSKNKITQKAMMAHSALKIFPKGSLIIAMYGATIGKVSILGIDACTNQACCVLCESKYLNTRFVFYYFVAKRQDLISMAYGGGQPNISQDIIKNFKIPLPPLQEQKEIAEFLDSKVAQINSAIEKTKRQIELVKEYKNTLINEAICGRMQLDKRRG